MPDLNKVKVIFRKVIVRKNADFLSDGDLFFIASVDGQPVGDRNTIFQGGKGDIIVLPQPLWSKEISIVGKNQFRIQFHGIDQDGFLNGDDDDLGTVDRLVRVPFHQESDAFGQTAFFILVYDIEVPVDGRFGRHPPGDIVASRVVPGGVDVTTISTTSFLVRAEAHPVIPTPTGPAPPAVSAAPIRPAVPGGITEDLNGQRSRAGNISATCDFNVLPNPAVIPILTVGDNVKSLAEQQRVCARIEITYFRPGTMAFTPNDPRLRWTFRPTAGGTVEFLGPNQGTLIFVKGLTVGEGVLECRLAGELLCTYRALIRDAKRFRCRFNIIRGIVPAGTADAAGVNIPRSTAGDIQQHLHVANVFLHSLGIELFLDTDPAILHTGIGGRRNATVAATGTPGIFNVRVPLRFTRNVLTPANTDIIAKVNFREGVMNFAYIINDNIGTLGTGDHFPNHPLQVGNARPSIVEAAAHTPSSSWIKPSGVTPDGAAAAVTMNLILGNTRTAGLFAMHVTDTNVATPAGGGVGSPISAASLLQFGSTIAHEFCHCLNLGHRVEGRSTAPAPGAPIPDAPPGTPLNQMQANGVFFDGLFHPPTQNVMHWDGDGTQEHDFDIIQALGARRSRFVGETI